MNPFLRLLPKTLLGQILAGFTIVILSYSLIILATHSFFEGRFFLTLQQETGEQHVTFLSRFAATGLYTENPLHLREPIKAIMDRPEVAAVAIYRQDGNLWVKESKADFTFASLSRDTVLAFLAKSRQGQRLEPVITSRICDFIAPITITRFEEFAESPPAAEQQVIIGLAEVRLSPAYRQAQVRRVQLFDLAVTSLSILLSVIVGLWLSRRLSAPVRALTAGAKQAAVGQFPEPIENSATGELADLTRAFNRMIVARKEAETNLYQELMLNEGLAKLSRELISSTDSIEKIAHFVLIMARQLTGSKHGFVSSIDQKTGGNVCHTLTEMIKDQCEIKPDRQEIAFSHDQEGKYQGLWGHVLNSRKSLYSNDPPAHPASAGVPAGHVRIDKFLSVPVIFHGELVGQIALANPGRDYSEHDVANIERLADLYALAVNRHRALQEREKLLADLRQAQKMEAIGTLAGGIAHDFNNILSAILGFTEISLMQVDNGSKLHHNLSMVQKAGDRARDLVAQILTFSRRSQAERHPILVAPIIKEALKLLRASLPSNIEIRQDIQPGNGKVLADPVQIHQIMMNLCTNAFHAMGGKGGVLEIILTEDHIDRKQAELDRDLHPGPYQRLSIRDTGSGIRPEIVDRIFEPFFTTKEKGQGTGMGLSMVHGIIKEYNGAIKVRSDVGQGTVFHLYFPLIRDTVSRTDSSRPPLLVRGKGRILLVDDEKDLAEMGRKLLEMLGYDIVSCTGSMEALEIFKKEPDSFDLVVTDQTMPAMSGAELAREIMRIRPQLPVFLCTGYSSFITEQDAKQLGIREFFLKPVSTEELSRAIQRHLC
ncbi:MAG: ATP-binding protein [Thermodesulfobacteriota bacterium]